MSTMATTAEDELDEGTALASVPGLSRCERCLLEELARPDSPRLTVAEVAKRAGISTASYHRFMRDPDFRATATKLIASMLLRRMSPRVARLLGRAKAGGEDGDSCRRQLLDPEHRKAIETANLIAATQTRILGGKVVRNIRGHSSPATEGQAA
jgi:AcrR family transcriptional regulator